MEMFTLVSKKKLQNLFFYPFFFLNISSRFTMIVRANNS